MFLALLATLGSAAPETLPSRPPWATITRSNSAASLRLDLGTLGAVSQLPYQLAYYVRRTSSRIGRAGEVRWADSISCPQLINVIETLRNVPAPRIDVPGFAGQRGGIDETLQLDGTGYSLDLSGRMRFSTGEGSPLAAWSETALRQLEPCWRAETPRDVG